MEPCFFECSHETGSEENRTVCLQVNLFFLHIQGDAKMCLATEMQPEMQSKQHDDVQQIERSLNVHLKRSIAPSQGRVAVDATGAGAAAAGGGGGTEVAFSVQGLGRSSDSFTSKEQGQANVDLADSDRGPRMNAPVQEGVMRSKLANIFLKDPICHLCPLNPTM